MEIVSVWINKFMIQKIGKPGVILEVTKTTVSYVPKTTIVESHYNSKVRVSDTHTLPIIFVKKELAKYFVKTYASHISDEYEIVNATHEAYTKLNEAFYATNKDDLADITSISWSNVNDRKE